MPQSGHRLLINLSALELAVGYFVMQAQVPYCELQDKYDVMNMMRRFEEALDTEKKFIINKQDKEIVEHTIKEVVGGTGTERNRVGSGAENSRESQADNES